MTTDEEHRLIEAAVAFVEVYPERATRELREAATAYTDATTGRPPKAVRDLIAMAGDPWAD